MVRRVFDHGSGRVSAVAIAIVIALGFGGVPASATPAVKTAAAADPAPITAEDTPLNDAWEPPAAADGPDAGESNAPTDGEWELPPVERTLPAPEDPEAEEGTAGRAPVGTVVKAPGLGALPYFSFDQTDLSTDMVARVNLGNGNLLLTAADGNLSGPALSARNDRFYNGLSSADGSFGGGWSSSLSALDTGLSVTSTTATYLGANGFKVVFTKSGSTWVSPAGFNAKLTEQTSTKTITFNQSGEQLMFNTAGRITKDLNRNGEGTIYTYNTTTNLLSKVTEASGRNYTITWSGIGASAKITQVHDSAGRDVDYTQNSSGQLTRVDAPGDYWSEFSYDTTGRLSEIRFIGISTPLAQRVVFGYDGNHRVASIKRGVVGASTFNTEKYYSWQTAQTQVTDGNGGVTTHKFNANGLVENVIDQLGFKKDTKYTAGFNVETTTAGYSGSASTGISTTYGYDALNNVSSIELPTGAAAAATYATGTSCAGTGGTVFQPKCSTDAQGNGKAFDYDAKGNQTKTTDTTSGGTGSVTQQFVYEAGGGVCGGFDGQICQSRDGNNQLTTYTYDVDGNLTTVTPPAPQGPTSYTYDSLGRVKTVTDPLGKVTTYVYNTRDAIVKTTFQSGQSVTNYFYPNALPLSEVDSTGPEKRYSYDVLGRITTQQQITSAATVEATFTYDDNGNMLTFDDGLTGTTTYGYSATNRLKQSIEPGGSCTSGTTNPAASSGCIKYSYAANGIENLRQFPGGATVATVSDASGRATRITAKDSSNVVKSDVGYTYTTAASADSSVIQKRTSYLEVGIPAGAITTYGYDSLSRVVSAVEKSGTTTNASWTYAYDAAGNRTSQTRAGNTGIGTGPGTITYAYDAASRISSTNADTTTWSFDAAGNQLRNGITGVTATYNDRGATTTIGSLAYTAFGAGNQTQLSRGTTNYTTTVLGLSRESVNGSVRLFTRTGGGDTVATQQPSGVDVYYVKDSLDSVIGLFDKTGAWAGGYAYSPYGERRNSVTGGSIADTNSLRYISGYADRSNSGIYKLGARYYDPSLGRFTSYDPSGQEKNPMAYGLGNPINGSDRTGLAYDLEAAASTVANFTGAGAGIGGLIGCGVGLIAAGAGCIPAAGTGLVVGGLVGAAFGVGYAIGKSIAGGYNI